VASRCPFRTSRQWLTPSQTPQEQPSFCSCSASVMPAWFGRRRAGRLRPPAVRRPIPYGSPLCSTTSFGTSSEESSAMSAEMLAWEIFWPRRSVCKLGAVFRSTCWPLSHSSWSCGCPRLWQRTTDLRLSCLDLCATLRRACLQWVLLERDAYAASIRSRRRWAAACCTGVIWRVHRV